jgi:predicted deacetylase
MKINVSIDDVSPHPYSSVKVLDRCYELIETFPDIKFSLFVPIAYWRTIKPGIATPKPLYINEYPDFCETLRNLPSRNFEVCYHGLYHGIPGKSDNDEFQHLTLEEATKKFQEMFEVVRAAGLSEIFKSIFRPPAWRMSSGSIHAAQQVGVKLLALSPKEYAKETYRGAENTFPRVVYYNCNPPFDPLCVYPSVEIVYHACEWDKNYLSKELANQLKTWIVSADHNPDFAFLEDM